MSETTTVEYDQTTLWVCQCCLLVLANDDDSGCRDYYNHKDGPGEEHPEGLAEFRGLDHLWVVPAVPDSEHAPDCLIRSNYDLWSEQGCECGRNEVSLNTCDGCGNRPEGYTYREAVTGLERPA